MMKNRRFLLFLSAALISFLVLSLVLGESYGMYNRVWWWDDMLHAVSGILFAFVGLYVLRILERSASLTLKPITVALFTFCFAITSGVVWEIYEFVLDVQFGFTMQQWNMPPNAIVMGESYQGMGLRDTMSDLVLASIGSLMASSGIYSYNRRSEQPRVVRQRSKVTARSRHSI